MWDLQLLDEPSDVFDHAVEPFVGAIGVFHDHHFHLVKLVQAIQTTDIFAVGTRFPSETRRVGGVPLGQILFLEDVAPVKIGHGYFRGGYAVEIVGRDVVHLPFLIGKLPRSVG